MQWNLGVSDIEVIGNVAEVKKTTFLFIAWDVILIFNFSDTKRGYKIKI